LDDEGGILDGRSTGSRNEPRPFEHRRARRARLTGRRRRIDGYKKQGNENHRPTHTNLRRRTVNSIHRRLPPRRRDTVRAEKLLRPGFEQRQIRRRLEEEKALLDVALGLFRRSRRTSRDFAVAPRGVEYRGRGLFDTRVLHVPSQSEREREIAGADEDHVDSWRRRDLVEMRERRRLLHHDDDHDVAIGGIEIAVWLRPARRRQAGA